MCLAVPFKILSIAEDGKNAVAECMGVKKEISLELMDSEVSPGDYILIHVGLAIRKINTDAAERTLKDHRQMAEIYRQMNS
ncbi:MAG: HypC/HybG/HupF family hydrogenase formation chaperone [Spirochaetia bacterium]|nr:HypC/HybG/HupF family hydrogenase formation chaperone [Spirochaetia bacterium]